MSPRYTAEGLTPEQLAVVQRAREEFEKPIPENNNPGLAAKAQSQQEVSDAAYERQLAKKAVAEPANKAQEQVMGTGY
ncbi:MAG: hypothetical protein OXE57_06435 [Alphaproteobacteria bacterium]|nr:hypothetical protein [Alphaproteobacteria bacterium]